MAEHILYPALNLSFILGQSYILSLIHSSSHVLEPNKDKKKQSTDKTTFILNGRSAVQGEG